MIRSRGGRVRWLVRVSLMSLFLGGCGTHGEQSPVVRIGYQKTGSLNLLRLRRVLEPALSKIGVRTTWVGFPAGPQLLEALNAGSIDFGHAGDAPPVLAQAAGIPFVYVGYEPARPHAEAILVPAGSSLRTMAELKGKRVALNKGSNVHYLLVRALERAGLSYADVRAVFLPPSDARAAFEGGSIDAWVAWDPYYAEAETRAKARVLTDGDGLVANREFQFASRDFARDHPEVIAAILDCLREQADWSHAHADEVVRLFASDTGLDADIVRRLMDRKRFGVAPMENHVIDEQQHVADVFARLGLIPQTVDVRAAVLKVAPNAPQKAGG